MIRKTESGAIESVNKQLAQELRKSVIKDFAKRKVYGRFREKIWAADWAGIESLSSDNKNVKYLLCFMDVFTKYALVKPLKDKNGKRILNVSIKIVNESNCKPNKLWIDQGRKFHSNLMQQCLNFNDLLKYSIYEGKSAISERIIKTLKVKPIKNDS